MFRDVYNNLQVPSTSDILLMLQHFLFSNINHMQLLICQFTIVCREVGHENFERYPLAILLHRSQFSWALLLCHAFSLRCSFKNTILEIIVCITKFSRMLRFCSNIECSYYDVYFLVYSVSLICFCVCIPACCMHLLWFHCHFLE